MPNLMSDLDLDPVTNPDAQEALSASYSNRSILIIPLSSGRIAIYDRRFILRFILDDTPTTDQIKELSTQFALELSTAAAARFYGEPSDKQFISDAKTARKIAEQKPLPHKIRPSQDSLALDL